MDFVVGALVVRTAVVASCLAAPANPERKGGVAALARASHCRPSEKSNKRCRRPGPNDDPSP